MTFVLSRLMSGATAAYAGYCFARPGHLGAVMTGDSDDPGYQLLAHVFGVRDAAVSTFGVLGRSEHTVRTAMLVRVMCDLGDGVVLARRAEDAETRAKVLGVTGTWAALNLTALGLDTLRTRRAGAAKRALDAVVHAV